MRLQRGAEQDGRRAGGDPKYDVVDMIDDCRGESFDVDAGVAVPAQVPPGSTRARVCATIRRCTKPLRSTAESTRSAKAQGHLAGWEQHPREVKCTRPGWRETKRRAKDTESEKKENDEAEDSAARTTRDGRLRPP